MTDATKTIAFRIACGVNIAILAAVSFVFLYPMRGDAIESFDLAQMHDFGYAASRLPHSNLLEFSTVDELATVLAKKNWLEQRDWSHASHGIPIVYDVDRASRRVWIRALGNDALIGTSDDLLVELRGTTP